MEYEETRRVDQQKPKTQIKIKMKEYGKPLRDLPEWLEEFTENLVDDRAPEHRDAPSSSRELSIFRAASKNNKGSLQRTHWYSRASSGTFR